jgi:hypothetical protein
MTNGRYVGNGLQAVKFQYVEDGLQAVPVTLQSERKKRTT